MFNKAKAGYRIENLAACVVSIFGSDDPFEDALKDVLKQIGAKFVVKDGIYVVTKIDSGSPKSRWSAEFCPLTRIRDRRALHSVGRRSPE